MIDLHCHILSHADDGAHNSGIALEMLREEVRQGVNTVCLTPHLRRGMFELSDYEIEDSYLRIRDLVSKHEIPVDLYLSREYYADRMLERKLEDRRVVPLGKGNCLLLEFSDRHSLADMKRYIARVQGAGYQPLIAHPERCRILRRSMRNTLELVRKGALLQCTASALLGREGFGVRQYINRLIKRDLIYVVATDAHDLHYRYPDLGDCRQYLRSKVSADYAEKVLYHNQRRLMELPGWEMDGTAALVPAEENITIEPYKNSKLAYI